MERDERPILTIDGVTARENRLINHFFHDFKGELCTVLMCLQSIRDGLVGPPPNPAQLHWLAHAIDDTQHMVKLINDYRDLTQMEEGAFTMQPEVVALGPRLRGLLADVREPLGERGLALDADVPDLPSATFAARLFDRLVQGILQVALYNARRETTLRIRAADVRRDDGHWLEVVVRLEGVTFPPERLESVFDKLAQTREGLQLGRGYTLLFCREAARTLGGQLLLAPWEGRGNEVALRLPLAPVDEGDEA